jgi:hypothetical protein
MESLVEARGFDIDLKRYYSTRSFSRLPEAGDTVRLKKASQEISLEILSSGGAGTVAARAMRVARFACMW